MIARYVHPSDVLAYLDAGWRAVGIDERYRSQVMVADNNATEPTRGRKLTERHDDDL